MASNFSVDRNHRSATLEGLDLAKTHPVKAKEPDRADKESALLKDVAWRAADRARAAASLNKEDRALIAEYSGWGFHDIQTTLRSGKKDKNMEKKETGLNQVIQKFQDNGGNHIGTSVRGVRLHNALLDASPNGEFSPEGSVFVDKAFTSTSKEGGIARRYADQNGDEPKSALITYIGRSGADWTGYGFDKEVIFGSKIPFSVLFSGIDKQNKLFRRVYEEKDAFPAEKGKSAQGISHFVDVGTLSATQKALLQKIQATTKSPVSGIVNPASGLDLKDQVRINLAFALQHFPPARLYQLYKQHLRSSDDGGDFFNRIASRVKRNISGTKEAKERKEFQTLKSKDNLDEIMEMLARHMPPKAMSALNDDLNKLVDIHKSHLLERRQHFDDIGIKGGGLK